MNVSVNVAKHNRLVEIDILKGLGILAMVAGHVGFGELFNFAIHPFNMPLFILVSGFLYRCKGSFSLSIKKKVKTLLVPYILFGLLFCIIWLPVQLARGEPLLDLAFHLFLMNSEGIPIGGALWFLTAFFFASALFDLVFRLSRGGVLLAALSIAVGCVGFFWPNQLPWCVNQAFVGMLLMYVGFAFRRSRMLEKVNVAPPYMIVLVSLFGSFAAYLNGFVNMRTNTYGNPLLFIFAAISLTFVMYYISLRLATSSSKLTDELKYIGSNSMGYLCMNQAVLLFPMKLLSGFNLYILNLIILILAMAVLHWLVRLLVNKFPLMLGK